MMYTYIWSFFLGCIGSIGYFLSLTIYGNLARFKTTGGRIREYRILAFCILGGAFAALLQTTVKGTLAPIHALVVGAGWVVIFSPIRNAVYQIQEERRNYVQLVEASLIQPTKKCKVVPVKDVMRKDLTKVSLDATIADFWPKLRNNESHLIIIEQHSFPDKMVGIIGKRDIIDFVLKEKNLRGAPAREVMNRNFTWVEQNEPVDGVIAIMNQTGLDRIVVLDKNEKAVGWVTRKTLQHDIIAKFCSKN